MSPNRALTMKRSLLWLLLLIAMHYCGLRLSLTYDMVVKGHGGSIAVDTKEGEFTEMIVSLPL